MDAGDAKTQKETKKLEKKIHKIFTEAEQDINNKIASFDAETIVKNQTNLNKVASGEWTQEEYNKWQAGRAFQSKQWKAKQEQIIHTVINANTIAINMVNGAKSNVFAYNANYQAYQIENELGLDVGFGLWDSTTVANLVENNPQVLPKWKVDEEKDYIWNKKKVNNAITQGIIQGERIDQISARLVNDLVTKNEKKMDMFARTGMTQAQNAGRYERLMESKKMGIEVVKMWMATLDGRTRDSHRDLDGMELPVSDYRHPMKFPNGCRYPGDPSAPASEVYNCRCKLVGSLPKYAEDFERRDQIEGKPIPYMTYSDWETTKKVRQVTGVNSFVPSATRFKRDFDKAKSTLPKGGEWRVDDTYTVEDYKHKKRFELDGGSVVAVTPQGDIVSVCKNLKGNDRGSDLLKIAIANGGNRLDAFGDGLFNFYTKNGFEPVSWTPFNEEYAPHDWVKGRDNPEPVIFYVYTGKQTSITYSEFIKNLSNMYLDKFDDKGEFLNSGYDLAKEARDRLIDGNK